MATFKLLTQTETNEHHRHIFELIAQHESETEETNDGYAEIALDAGELDQIRDEMTQIVQDARPGTQTATEMKEKMFSTFPQRMHSQLQMQQRVRELKDNPGIVQDGYMNEQSGIGTLIDPGMQTESFIPVSITPTEATAYYSNGGIPARIINKKAGCLSLDGVKFKCDAFTPDDITTLEAYAEKTGFNKAYSQGITQSLIFGGAAVYPVLESDNPLKTQYTIQQLLIDQRKEKDFIKYWVTADRWNCVFVPNYNITAQDYLYAHTLFIPLGGVRVNTQRMAMIKPSTLPFWGAIQQMGWTTSDFEGWVKDFEAYQIMKMSLPIMAQQCSLMYHSMPADGLIIENGPAYARKFFQENENEMRNWSMLHPKAINSVGEIKVIERTYSGFRDLINESRLALCASSSVPESVLFAEKATGLASDNKDDIELKQSEAIRLLFNNVAPAFKNCIELLVYSCFGKNSEQARHAREVTIAPDNGVILSDQDKAQLGQSFTAIAGQLNGMGLPLKTAITLAQKFVPSAEIGEDTMNEITAGESEGIDEESWDIFNAGRKNMPQEEKQKSESQEPESNYEKYREANEGAIKEV